MSCGQTPRRRHAGPIRTGWGLSSVKRRGGCRAGPLGAPSGDRAKPPVLMMPPSRGAWRCKRGRGRSLPGRADESRRLQARRAETGLAATVGYRHAAAAALDGKRKGVKGTLAALAAAPPVSHSEATVRPFQLSYPTPAPGPRDADSGRGRPCLARATRLDALSDRVARGRRERDGGAAPRSAGR